MIKRIPRDVGQTLIAKVDQGLMKPVEAKRYIAATYGVQVKGVTRDQVSKSIGSHMEAP